VPCSITMLNYQRVHDYTFPDLGRPVHLHQRSAGDLRPTDGRGGSRSIARVGVEARGTGVYCIVLYMGTAARCVAEVLTVQSILVKFCGISL